MSTPPTLTRRLFGWLFAAPAQEHGHHAHPTWPWYRVLWLTGVDYFSTLGYQPGLALLAAGALSPLATGVLVLVTLFGALPIYRQVARRSYDGQGSISMLERLVPGWPGKLMVLALLGFATTDFVITMTLSAADAAQHAAENPLLHHLLEGHQVGLTLLLLAMLAVVFLRGFREAIGLATWLAVPYLLLNLVVVGRGAWEIAEHPEHLAAWTRALALRGDPTALVMLSLLTFPKLALGLSGFETGVSVMPLVAGTREEDAGRVHPPAERIRATGHLLTGAAVIMSGFLIGSSLVSTMLIDEATYKGEASGRALAWLAHTYLGSTFGTIYDVSTILILWFAGASAMAAMLNLIPRYLPRFGMAPAWVQHARPLVLVIFAIDVVVTLAFHADVEAQGGAYATGVLALIVSASIAVTLAVRKETLQQRRSTMRVLPWVLITGVFLFTFVDNIVVRPDGIIISAIFIGATLILGAVSRSLRATELRVEDIEWVNERADAPVSGMDLPDGRTRAITEELFEHMRRERVNIVTIKDAEGVLRTSPHERLMKERRRREAGGIGGDTPGPSHQAIFHEHREQISQHYRVEGAFCFVHVDLDADVSRFDTRLRVWATRVGSDYAVVVSNATAVPNAIAWIVAKLEPRSVFLGLTAMHPMRQAFNHLVFGTGETGLLVYRILLRHWESTPEDEPRPNIHLLVEGEGAPVGAHAPGT
ncbi:MAG: hypothetical protein RLZZ299_1363 [Pseudomonadota bacterium]